MNIFYPIVKFILLSLQINKFVMTSWKSSLPETDLIDVIPPEKWLFYKYDSSFLGQTYSCVLMWSPFAMGVKGMIDPSILVKFFVLAFALELVEISQII